MTSPEQRIWQAVVVAALRDALPAHGVKAQSVREMTAEQYAAHHWLVGRSRDFTAVCGLAGVDPDALRTAYLSGSIDPESLRSEAKRRAKALTPETRMAAE